MNKAQIGKALLASLLLTSLCVFAAGQELQKPAEGDYLVHDFHFRSGQVLQELHIHYSTVGRPVRDSNGHVTNAVLILHPTSADGKWYLQSKSFAGELFGPGQLLDATRYFIIALDAIGHGRSSKPSDGLHARFPHYDYEDMVKADYLLLTEGLKVDHMRLLMGMSMGCMHAFLFAENYPDFLDAAMPLAWVKQKGRWRLVSNHYSIRITQ